MNNLKIVLATRNRDKIIEIKDILDDNRIQLLSLDFFNNIDDIIEDGDTFLENSRKKACTVYENTGLPALADDSGLEVDFLKGAPGVRSRRFAGENSNYKENNLKLLSLLKNVNWEQRTARFRTIVFFKSFDEYFWTEGICEGIINTEICGNNGFGYDPLFYIPCMRKTFSEMSTKEKNKISHRGIAFRKMSGLLDKWIANQI